MMEEYFKRRDELLRQLAELKEQQRLAIEKINQLTRDRAFAKGEPHLRREAQARKKRQLKESKSSLLDCVNRSVWKD